MVILDKQAYNKLLHRTPQAVTIFAEQKYVPTCYAGEQGVISQKNIDVTYGLAYAQWIGGDL